MKYFKFFTPLNYLLFAVFSYPIFANSQDSTENNKSLKAKGVPRIDKALVKTPPSRTSSVPRLDYEKPIKVKPNWSRKPPN